MNGGSMRSDESIIEDIQKVREKNNKLWMQILRIATKTQPEETKLVMKKIRKNDIKISELTGELANE